MVHVVTADTFEEEVLKADKPVLLDCYADWCGPCKMMAPVFEKLSETYGEVKFCKLNVDEDADAVADYNVRSIPNFLAFKGGEMVKNAVGAMNPGQFEALVKELI